MWTFYYISELYFSNRSVSSWIETDRLFLCVSHSSILSPTSIFYFTICFHLTSWMTLDCFICHLSFTTANYHLSSPSHFNVNALISIFPHPILSSSFLSCLHFLPFCPQDPDTFNPDRWAPDAPGLERMNEIVFPFALGKRTCIGQNLANYEIKFLLATLFRKFRFELKTEVVMDFFFSLKPGNALFTVHKV